MGNTLNPAELRKLHVMSRNPLKSFFIFKVADVLVLREIIQKGGGGGLRFKNKCIDIDIQLITSYSVLCLLIAALSF